MFGMKISEKVGIALLALACLVGVGLTLASFGDTSKVVKTVSARTEKATCEIGTVTLDSTDTQGNAIFSLNLNPACQTAGKWIVNTVQYHYSKGFVGINQTIPSASLVNDTITVPNLGNNGYEEKIVQFLFFPNTKQVASEKDIIYWDASPTIYKSKNRTEKATCQIGSIIPGNVGKAGLDLTVTTSNDCNVPGKWRIDYTMSFNNSSNTVNGSVTASTINKVIHISGITSAYRNEVSVGLVIQFFPNGNQEQSVSVARFSV